MRQRPLMSMLLFPEMCKLEDAEDTKSEGFLPAGHVDKGGDIYGYPIPGHCQWGTRGIECVTHPEGVIGKAKLADPEEGLQDHRDLSRLCGEASQ